MLTQNFLRTIHISLLNVDDCCVQNWNFRKVISPFTRLYLIKGGEGNVIHNNQKYNLQAGKLYLIPSFTLSNYSSSTFLDHYYIHFIPQMTGELNLYNLLDFEYELDASVKDICLVERILKLNPEKKLINTDPFKYSLTDLVPKTETLVSSGQIASYLETQGILLQLFSRFIKTDNPIRKSSDFQPNRQIIKVIDYIHENLINTIRIKELAEMCNVSSDYFSRLFLKIMGTRPIEYINRKRIESAQILLITSDDPIEKIALETGIENISYFNRLFKKYSCSTPGEYRKLHQLV
ncbi:MAG: AraC family transcriptional regulator [Bacteroidales bacterium]